MSGDLLNTKLYVPTARPSLVPRPHLTQKLNQALNVQLTLVSAPAGFGKTTLISSWVRQGAEKVAWLSLDEGDNDPARFLAYLTAALQEILPDISQFATRSIAQGPHLESLLTTLINHIAGIPENFILALDDYHLIAEPTIHDTLAFLLDHQPPPLHLVIITRADPPVPLASLRARGQLIELRAPDLRFTTAEATQFLNTKLGLDLSPADVAVLEKRTEGWIAGLQMAAISMQGRQDKSRFIKEFSGDHHFILDYLVEEVLEQQPQAVQEFLLKTAVLKRMNASLCSAVTDGRNSQAILTRLEQANLFLVPLDDKREWYRYHHLFAAILDSLLRQRESAAQIRELHRRASRWHQNEGSLEEAMFHAIAANDFEHAAIMIEENIASMFARSEVPVLLGWIDKIPREIVHGRPWIDVYRATTLALASQLDGVDPLLDGVEKRIDSGAPQSSALLGHIAAVRAYSANLRGDASRAIAMAALTKKYLPDAHLTARGMAAYAMAAYAMAAYAVADTYFAADDLDSAGEALLEMLKVGQRTGQLMLSVPALCDLAAIKQVQGRLYQAEELFNRAYQQMKVGNGLDSRLRCAYEFGVANLLREWNQLDAAHEHAQIGIELRQRLGGYLVVGDIALMRILQARGDTEGAMEALHNAEKMMQTYPFQLATTIAFKTARVVQLLAVGDVPAAVRYAKECDGGTELEQIALARLYFAQERPSAAHHLLEQQRRLAHAAGRNGRLIEILALQAVALQAQDQTHAAVTALSQALSLASPEGYKRLFLDIGYLLREILHQSNARDTSKPEYNTTAGDYVRSLLAAFQQEDEAQRIRAASQPPPLAEPLFDPLTNREQEILQLLAQGLTNKEIAASLVVAPSTVKQHLKHIYSKLDVHSRTQAVARAQELNLL